MSELQHYTTDQTYETLSQAIDELWEEARASGAIRTMAETNGVAPEMLEESSREDLVLVERRGAGLDPGTTAILITLLTPVAAKAASGVARVVEDVWKEIILPKLRQRFGVDGLRPKA